MEGDILVCTTCCGLKEIDGLKETPNETVFYVCVDFFDNDIKGAFIIFTDVLRSRRGLRLQNYIQAKKLGKITESSYKRNPNSGNRLKVWVWEVNEKKLQR
mgnify:FL=1